MATIAGSSFFLLKYGNSTPIPVPAYRVMRVIDGDTFETTEKQLIRFSSANAPELDQCGGPEAKTALEKLVLDKPIYIKVQYRDPFYRLISLVYSDTTFINEEMVAQGHAYYAKTGKDDVNSIQKAAEKAREEKIGIYDSICTQLVNTKNPTCTIKGNVNSGKIYYTENCFQYQNAIVELYKGDQWFCSEKAALQAGFRKGVQCP